eukprot:GHVO01053988.1.p1 GENE.GHVO01053988.1~~GHVO01053988.1.p1  ORF type:complete len:245 (+),score=38.03 GHVO01053988.1:316-1050(+)
MEIIVSGEIELRIWVYDTLLSGVWIPKAQRPPSHQTVIIFDWDDTLLCTSYLNGRLDLLKSKQSIIHTQLSQLANAGIEILKTAQRLGRVFIITNAMEGWCQFSAQKYLPKLHEYMEFTTERIPVISARYRFEESFPGAVEQWKIHAFLEVQRSLNNQIITNLISLGDSSLEMDAVHVMGKEFAQALVKTVKFRENPNPDELTKQLDLVNEKFERICVNAKNLRIGLEKKCGGRSSTNGKTHGI